jgi:hypothetical protein
MMETRPPELDEVEDAPELPPPMITISPPVPLLPAPTVIYNAPPRPLDACPEPINNAPVLPDPDTPVLKINIPLTPLLAESVVDKIKSPALFPSTLVPEYRETRPPLRAPDIAPDLNTNSPPRPLLPLPLVTYTAPPRPLDAAPEPMYNAPVLPDPEVPVLKISIPLTPLLTASPVLSAKSPLLL